MVFIGTEFSNALVSVVCLARVSFFFCFKLCRLWRWGVYLKLTRLDEGAAFSDAVDDESSLEDGARFSTLFFSDCLKVMPLACLGIGFPPFLSPVWAFRFFSDSESLGFVVSFGIFSWAVLSSLAP